MSHAGFVAAWLAGGAACASDYGFYPKVEDLGDPSDPGETDETTSSIVDDVCYRFDEDEYYESYDLSAITGGGVVGDVCAANVVATGGDTTPSWPYRLVPPPGPLLSYELRGSDGSMFPDAAGVRLVQSVTYNGFDNSYPWFDNLFGDVLPSVPAGGGWLATDTLTGNLCEQCAFSPVVEIHDAATATTGLTGQCELNEAVEFCPHWGYLMAARGAPVMSQCASGNGRFRLVPQVVVDRDGDSSRSLLLRAHQVSGTGQMTGHAWITSVEQVGTWLVPVRLARPSRVVAFDDSDQLASGTNAVVIPPGGLTPPVGAFSGGAPFVMIEVPGSTVLDLQVDLAWACGDLQEEQLVNAPLGFSFVSSEVGCGTSAPQRFTVRPRPFGAPMMLDIEPYGQSGWKRVVPLTSTPNGATFNARIEQLSIAGSLVSWNSNNATFRLDEVAWGGVPVCAAGTYTVAAE